MSTWDTRRTAGAVVVAAVIAGFGGAAIAAATGGGYHMEASGGPGPNGPPRAAQAPKAAADAPDSLHGEFVDGDGHGGFVTHLDQTGAVTAISATSVTARSADGFSQTYTIREVNGAAPPPFSIGDQVTIEATREGEAAVVSTMRPPLAH